MMPTPSEWHCHLIRSALRAHVSNLQKLSKAVLTAGQAAEAANLKAAADTVREHILPMFGDDPPAPKGEDTPQITLDDAIAQAEEELRQKAEQAAAASPPMLVSGAVDPIDDDGCMQCGGEIPDTRGGDFCSAECERKFLGERKAEGVPDVEDVGDPPLDGPPPAEDDDFWTSPLCAHGVPTDLQVCPQCEAERQVQEAMP